MNRARSFRKRDPHIDAANNGGMIDMARSRKTEQRYLSEEELQLVDQTHLPALKLIQTPELVLLRKTLRESREKASSIPSKTRPVTDNANGKGSEGPGMRRDILSAAVKRVNRELDRRRTGTIERQIDENPLAAASMALNGQSHAETAPERRTRGETSTGHMPRASVAPSRTPALATGNGR
ncbi:hypothetical protein FHS85_003468 [Rhodoligotrophos appendicifer]|uniref:hypothetical protein n=1 Tax=Rhodoligotrophos appendicifer TaxID=987056 RepID=UPI001186C01E|nr:hypothetical protein [Rhodoligotrophos appendicifer]